MRRRPRPSRPPTCRPRHRTASPARARRSPRPSRPAPIAAMLHGSDDLTRIKGLGPKLAEQLHALGVTSFAQIAAWDEADIDRIDAQLGRFQGRIRRDDWPAQARRSRGRHRRIRGQVRQALAGDKLQNRAFREPIAKARFRIGRGVTDLKPGVRLIDGQSRSGRHAHRASGGGRIHHRARPVRDGERPRLCARRPVCRQGARLRRDRPRALPDCAILDVYTGDGEVYPLADALAEAGVPIIFHSGHVTAAGRAPALSAGAGPAPSPARPTT